MPVPGRLAKSRYSRVHKLFASHHRHVLTTLFTLLKRATSVMGHYILTTDHLWTHPFRAASSSSLLRQMPIVPARITAPIRLRNDPNDYDDCVATYFGAFSGTVYGSTYGHYTFNSVTQYAAAPASSEVGSHFILVPSGGVDYLDSSCQQVIIFRLPPPCDAGSYGSLSWVFGLTMSPISFLWTDEEDVDSQITTTEFPVDPNKRGQYFLWKGSGKRTAPRLRS